MCKLSLLKVFLKMAAVQLKCIKGYSNKKDVKLLSKMQFIGITCAYIFYTLINSGVKKFTTLYPIMILSKIYKETERRRQPYVCISRNGKCGTIINNHVTTSCVFYYFKDVSTFHMLYVSYFLEPEQSNVFHHHHLCSLFV